MRRCIFAFMALSGMSLSAGVAQEQKLQQIVHHELGPFMAAENVPGAALAVFYGDDPIFINYGLADKRTGRPVTSDTIFELASVTKVFTSTELALQVLKGRMRLDDPVVKYLPMLRQSRLAIDKVTLVELATHASSLPRVPPKHHQHSFHSIVEFLRVWRPQYPIGTHYAYSNLAFGVLGQALSNAVNKPYAAMIADDILAPLDMRSTMTQVPAHLQQHYAQGYDAAGRPAARRSDNPWPGSGALRSTARDMLKFLEANMGAYGPKELRAAMQMAQKGVFQAHKNLVLGLGWQRVIDRGRLIIDKNGGVTGFSTYIGMLPSERVGVVLLMNKGDARATGVGRRILLALAEHKTLEDQ